MSSDQITVDPNFTDLDSETKTSGNNAELTPIKQVDIPALQESIRAFIVFFLLFCFGASILGIALYIYSERDPDKNLQLITLIWTSEVTLISGALGFYFGSNTK
jgi:magnesium-transporting ATPase (P-type)